MRRAVLVLLLAGVGTLSLAQQANDSDTKSKIIALEQLTRVQATKSKDLKLLDSLLDDAFVSVDQEGESRTKSEFLLDLQSTGTLLYTLDGMDARLHGNTVIVTGLYAIKGTEHEKPFLRRGRFVDTWLQKNGRWVVIASLSAPNP